MMMHTRHSTNDGIEIPFHIDGLGPNGGWDRSRTWIVSRTGAGLRLKHDHRHADGTPHAVTLYGGDTADAGTAARQNFPVDAESMAILERNGRGGSTNNLLPRAHTNAAHPHK